MSIKSIRPITATASSMPSKAVAPLGSTVAKAPISVGAGIRDSFTKFGGLPTIGAQKVVDGGSRNKEQGSKLDSNLPYAFLSIGSSNVKNKTKAYNFDYVNSFSDYSGYIKALNTDFGAGVKKIYQTPSGPQQLYEFQYKNLLRYGDIKGPAMQNDFTFRDGRWWSTRTVRNQYNAHVDGTIDPLISKYGLTDDEKSTIYGIAQKNNLNEEQYLSLYHTAYAKKYYQDAAAGLAPYVQALSQGGKAVPGVSTTARYGSVFGDGNPGIHFLKDYGVSMNALGTQFQDALEGLKAVGLNAAAGAAIDAATGHPIGLGNLLVGSNPGTSLVSAVLTTMFGKKITFDNLSQNFQNAYLAPFNIIDNLVNGISDWITGGGGKGINYDLVNSRGKIIDCMADITSNGDREGIKAIHNEIGSRHVTEDMVASVLGSLYRYRVLQAIKPQIDSFNANINTATSYFKNVSIVDFKV